MISYTLISYTYFFGSVVCIKFFFDFVVCIISSCRACLCECRVVARGPPRALVHGPGGHLPERQCDAAAASARARDCLGAHGPAVGHSATAHLLLAGARAGRRPAAVSSAAACALRSASAPLCLDHPVLRSGRFVVHRPKRAAAVVVCLIYCRRRSRCERCRR